VKASQSPWLLGLGVCAFVVGLELCVGSDPEGLSVARQGVYGLIGAVITVQLVIAMLVVEMMGSPLSIAVKTALFAGHVWHWGLAALWLTFTGPFLLTGNGYFGLWGAFACSSVLLLNVSAETDPPEPPSGGESQPLKVTSFRRRTESMWLADEQLFTLWGQFASSIVLILAAIALPSDLARLGYSAAWDTIQPWWAYALAVGIVGAVFSLLAALLEKQPVMSQSLFAIGKAGHVTLRGLFAGFLFLWWGVGAGILTIKAPYVFTTNGYFASWVGFACSLSGVGVTLARTKAAASSGAASLALLATCSVIALIETAIIVSRPYSYYRASDLYSLIVSAITIVDVLIVALARYGGTPCVQQELADLVAKGNSIVLFLLWAVLAGWCTFAGSFQLTGNGYFAAWGGVFATALLALAAWFGTPTAVAKSANSGANPNGAIVNASANSGRNEAVVDTGPNEAEHFPRHAGDEMA